MMNKLKNIMQVCLLWGILLSPVLTACGSDSEDELLQPEEKKEVPTKGDAQRPTEWLNWQENLSAEIYLLSNMTIVCDGSGIEFEPTSQDLVAAFVGDECRGCAKAQVIDGRVLFFLSVNLTSADDASRENGTPIMVSYRYYSAAGSKIYTCAPTPFEYDGRKGTLSNPYHFEWK